MRNWERHVNEVVPAGYLTGTYRFRITRETGAEIDFFRLIDRTVELLDTEGHLERQRYTPNHKPPRLAVSKAGPQ